MSCIDKLTCQCDVVIMERKILTVSLLCIPGCVLVMVKNRTSKKIIFSHNLLKDMAILTDLYPPLHQLSHVKKRTWKEDKQNQQTWVPLMGRVMIKSMWASHLLEKQVQTVWWTVWQTHDHTVTPFIPYSINTSFGAEKMALEDVRCMVVHYLVMYIHHKGVVIPER